MDQNGSAQAGVGEVPAVRTSPRFLPVGRSLASVVGIFVCIVISLLWLNNLRSEVLSSVRAYVSGEGLYSKSQKEAVNHLVRYTQTQAESDYEQYVRALAVPLGDRQARIELDKPQPDFDIAYRGFIAGHNHPEDVDNLILLFRRFRHVSYMARAIDVWAEADGLVEQLHGLGEELHASIGSGHPDPQRTAQILSALDILNDQLTVLEDEFSRTLGEANRWIERRLTQGTYAATVLLLASGVFLSWLIVRQVQDAERARLHADDLARARARQHEALAQLGKTALSGRDVRSLIDEAVASAMRMLEADLCAVFERADRAELRLIAGIGWRPGCVGHATVAADARSDAGYALATATPVVIEDVRTERRFTASPLLRTHGVVSGVSVVVPGQTGQAYGVLGIYAMRARRFAADDVDFLSTVADLLGVAIERKRAEEALQEANRQKDDFLSMLGHELRNPLSPIRNAVYVLRRIAPTEPQRMRAYETIERQVTHMTRLIDDLLDVSRVARGKIALQPASVDFAQLVRTAVEDHRPILEAAGLTLTVDVPEQPLWVRGDATRLSQSVGNLLHNASKFTDPGGRVTVHLAADANGRAAVLKVRDTGIGIEPQLLRCIFEPFSQADGGLSRTRGGLGLGLALVKGLVELHGGTVEASSGGCGHGAEFTVRLPLEPRAPMYPGPPPEEGQRPRACRVLVIEDNVDVAESMKAVLELDGHQVAVAYSGPSGMEVARRFRPEVVLCDIGLPGGMDGFAVAAAMREDAALGSPYLVALTGYGQKEDRRRARAAGFHMHLIKPVDPALLDRVLGHASERDTA